MRFEAARPPRAGRKRRRALRWLAALAVLAGVGFSAFYGGLVTPTYRVVSAKLANNTPIRIVVLSDLHGQIYGEDQGPLISKVEGLRPDVICLVGDMADEGMPLDGFRLLLEGIRGLAPCLYVTGSHEYWSDSGAIKAMARGLGVTVLERGQAQLAVKGQTLVFSGLDDPVYTPNQGYDMLLRPFERLASGAFHILLSHRPDPIRTFSAYGFDLVLSGHTHGGQVRVPFVLNGLYAPDQGWLPPYAGGLYLVNGTALVVSRGLSREPRLPRVFNPPEVVLVELHSKR